MTKLQKLRLDSDHKEIAFTEAMAARYGGLYPPQYKEWVDARRKYLIERGNVAIMSTIKKAKKSTKKATKKLVK